MVSKWLSGKHTPDGYNLMRLVEVIGSNGPENPVHEDDPVAALRALEDVLARVLPRLRDHLLTRREQPQSEEGQR